MYAILNFGPNWSTYRDHIAKAIASVVSGSTLASLEATELAGTNFNRSRSFRKSTDANHFWTKDTPYIVHAACDTSNAPNKFVRFSSVSAHVNMDLSTNINFVPISNGQAYNSSSQITPSNEVNIHIHCTKRCLVVGMHQEGIAPTVIFTSEITNELMPYLDSANNSFIPAVLSNLVGYFVKTVGTTNETIDAFKCPNLITNDVSGTSAQVQTGINWRIGNSCIPANPVTTSLGNSRLNVDGTDVDATLSLGVYHVNANATFLGSITDKSGIRIWNGPGYPETGSQRLIPPDSVLEIDGIEYVVFDRILIPFI